MAYVVGVDPGADGALAVYDTDSKRIVSVIDMPSMTMTINKKKRKRIDAVTLFTWLEGQHMCGCELVLIEAVSGRKGQGAGGAFTFGYGVGLIYMACVALKLPIETVPPQVWKRTMRVPGKKTEEKDKYGRAKIDPAQNGLIVNRADELMPDARHMFRGPMGGLKVDRAEAAMLAKYAGDYALRLDIKPPAALDWEAYATKLDTGA